MLGLRLPIVPLREQVVQMNYSTYGHNIYTPSFNCLNNRLVGEYELAHDPRVQPTIRLQHLLSDGKDLLSQNKLREKFTKISGMDIDFYDTRTNFCPLTPDQRPVICKLKRFPNVIVNVPMKYPFGAASAVRDILDEKDDWNSYSLYRFIL
jgi:hypothetical protein